MRGHYREAGTAARPTAIGAREGPTFRLELVGDGEEYRVNKVFQG